MIALQDVVNNRTICDVFGVASMGGIRVNNSRNLIVLVSNYTDPTYRNEWRQGILHFVGRGASGPQRLDRQNKTLAWSAKRGYALHLFEVFEPSKYVYAGEVELAGDAYVSDQADSRGEARLVWVFPLRKKQFASATAGEQSDPSLAYLPHGAYAVIRSGLASHQRELVNEAIDRLREAGVPIFDQRDVSRRRYEVALCRWHEDVLDRVRKKIRHLISQRRQAARAAGREFRLVDDELRITSASTESELRAALAYLNYDDPSAMEEVFEEARGLTPMPDPPGDIQETDDGIPESLNREITFDRSRFSDFS